MLLRLIAARFRASRDSAPAADLQEFDAAIEQLEHNVITPRDIVARAKSHVLESRPTALDLAVLAT